MQQIQRNLNIEYYLVCVLALIIILGIQFNINYLPEKRWCLDCNFPVLIIKDGQKLPDLKSQFKIAIFRPSEQLNELLNVEYSMTQFNEDLWIGERK